jgi:DNA excision repair protein ERCC-1
MVDIPNHEDPLRELSKTSMVNNVTIIACWSAAEAARYLELYKSYENANFDAIKGKQASTYADKLVEFVTVPRSLNKTDAVALVANFGSLKNAMNADTEQLGTLSGWGGVKIKRWTSAIEEPFRAKRAAKRGVPAEGASQGASRLEQAVPLSRVPLRDMPSAGHSESSTPQPKEQSQEKRAPAGGARQFQFRGDSDSDEDVEPEANIAQQPATAGQNTAKQSQQSQSQGGEELSGGIAAALAKLREN